MSTTGGYEPAASGEVPESRPSRPPEEFEDLYVETTPTAQPEAPARVPAPTHGPSPGPADLARREQAIQRRARKRVLKRRAFRGSLVSYLSVSLMLVVIWAVTMFGGFFWPIFPIMGMGLGVVAQAWEAYRTDDEDEIQREIERMRRRGIS